MRNDYSVDGIDLVSLFIFEENFVFIIDCVFGSTEQNCRLIELLLLDNFFKNKIGYRRRRNERRSSSLSSEEMQTTFGRRLSYYVRP